MKHPLSISVHVTSAMLLAPFAAFGQAPAVHWSTFNKPASGCACHLFARDAMLREHMRILEDAGSVLLGSNNKVIAETICLPGGNQVRISAFSADSAAAEQARNDIRASIVGAHLFDTCP